jgi:hypothetical protein
LEISARISLFDQGRDREVSRPFPKSAEPDIFDDGGVVYGQPPSSYGYQQPPPKKGIGCTLPLLGILGVLIAVIIKCDKTIVAANAEREQHEEAMQSAREHPTSAVTGSVGTEMQSGKLSATLREATVQGKTANVTFLLRNDQDKEQALSSVMEFQATDQDGNKGQDNTEATCDGTVPPHGTFNCKLIYEFERAPKELTLRFGSTLHSADAVYFKVTVGAKDSRGDSSIRPGSK